jgi:hypothetical protein
MVWYQYSFRCREWQLQTCPEMAEAFGAEPATLFRSGSHWSELRQARATQRSLLLPFERLQRTAIWRRVTGAMATRRGTRGLQERVGVRRRLPADAGGLLAGVAF